FKKFSLTFSPHSFGCNGLGRKMPLLYTAGVKAVAVLARFPPQNVPTFAAQLQDVRISPTVVYDFAVIFCFVVIAGRRKDSSATDISIIAKHFIWGGPCPARLHFPLP
ncbi:MAG: hypothetical protein ACPLRH_02930, partial [Desulfotomaculales bacterium]